MIEKHNKPHGSIWISAEDTSGYILPSYPVIYIRLMYIPRWHSIMQLERSGDGTTVMA